MERASKSITTTAKAVNSPLARVYERFLELPPQIVVITVMWLAGAVLIGFCGVVALYVLWLLLEALAGVS